MNCTYILKSDIIKDSTFSYIYLSQIAELQNLTCCLWSTFNRGFKRLESHCVLFCRPVEMRPCNELKRLVDHLFHVMLYTGCPVLFELMYSCHRWLGLTPWAHSWWAGAHFHTVFCYHGTLRVIGCTLPMTQPSYRAENHSAKYVVTQTKPCF